MYRIMTPGPTQVRENVRLARSRECTNPDLDKDFFLFYRDTCRLISSLLDSQNETLILGGEGILGLEAACASLTEPGDPVLVIANGIFGESFADFVKIYGGKPEVYTAGDQESIDVDELAQYLQGHHDFTYATVVHCDTPTGVKNAVEQICPLLKSYGILTVVDSVSAMFGEQLHVDAAQIDLVCGGSQKVVSAPPGLAFVTVSEDAKAAMRNRKTPIASFYANLMLLEGCCAKGWFPYTMPVSDINGLRAAMENIRDDADIRARHERIAAAVRSALCEAGLELFLKNGYASTVTAFCVPDGTTDREILDTMQTEHNIMLADSFGKYAGQLIRIGHMGENATEENVRETMRALDQTFESLGVQTGAGLEQAFLDAL
ncbi:MAG: alanine--glyoxylate aminotransferase family protein [Lachnospiraceae bacterium]|nr:alanine--glyoxylate aminotransferase family protein [Lachnospiraceae bacterium]